MSTGVFRILSIGPDESLRALKAQISIAPRNGNEMVSDELKYSIETIFIYCAEIAVDGDPSNNIPINADISSCS